MLLSLEMPAGMLELISPLTDFDFALTHLVLTNEEYREYYIRADNFLILDNSVNELNVPTTIKELEEAAKYINPDVICPPDFLLDADKTLDALEDAINTFEKEKLLPILQGNNFDVAVDCAWEIRKMGFNKIAIPYSITKDRKADTRQDMAETRYSIITTIAGLFEWVHLLGITNLEELNAYGEMTNVSTLDTGLPITAALKGYGLADNELHPKSQKLEYDSEVTPQACSLAFFNIAFLRTYLTQ